VGVSVWVWVCVGLSGCGASFSRKRAPPSPPSLFPSLPPSFQFLWHLSQQPPRAHCHVRVPTSGLDAQCSQVGPVRGSGRGGGVPLQRPALRVPPGPLVRLALVNAHERGLTHSPPPPLPLAHPRSCTCMSLAPFFPLPHPLPPPLLPLPAVLCPVQLTHSSPCAHCLSWVHCWCPEVARSRLSSPPQVSYAGVWCVCQVLVHVPRECCSIARG
jgi:hypothetical protein